MTPPVSKPTGGVFITESLPKNHALGLKVSNTKGTVPLSFRPPYSCTIFLSVGVLVVLSSCGFNTISETAPVE